MHACLRLSRRGGEPRRRISWQPPANRGGFKSLLGKTAKFVITGTVFYIGVAFLTGGTSRLQSDASIIKVGLSACRGAGKRGCVCVYVCVSRAWAVRVFMCGLGNGADVGSMFGC